jgi:hypothetical protein
VFHDNNYGSSLIICQATAFDGGEYRPPQAADGLTRFPGLQPLNARASPFSDGFNGLRFGCWLADLVFINFCNGPFNRSLHDFPRDTLLHSPFNSFLNRQLSSSCAFSCSFFESLGYSMSL